MTVFLIITIMLILVSSLAGLLFGATFIVDQSLDDPDVLMHAAISGNDIIVTIYEGGRVDELVHISLEIEGYSPVIQDVPKGERDRLFGSGRKDHGNQKCRPAGDLHGRNGETAKVTRVEVHLTRAKKGEDEGRVPLKNTQRISVSTDFSTLLKGAA